MSLLDRLPRLDAVLTGLSVTNGLSRSMLSAALEASPDCVKIIGPDGTLLFMNQTGVCAMELDDFADVKGAEWACLWPGETRERVTLAVTEAMNGASTFFEAACPTAKGNERWWQVRVTPVEENGVVKAVLSQSRDVTATIAMKREIEELRRRQESAREDAHLEGLLDAALADRLARLVNAETNAFRTRNGAAEAVDRLNRMTGQWLRTGTRDEKLALCQASQKRAAEAATPALQAKAS